MALWAARSTGVMFGGVFDEDTSEETLDSVFYQDMFGYQMTGNGRWISLTLRKQKQKGGKKVQPAQRKRPDQSDSETEAPAQPPPRTSGLDAQAEPEQTVPLPRYNALLAVLRNTLYIYGGIFERGSREYTLDDFYSLALDKLDRFVCLKPCDVQFADNDDSSEDGDDDDDDDDEEDGEEDEYEEGESEDEAAKPPHKIKKAAEEATTLGEVKLIEEEPKLVEDDSEDEVDELTQQAQAFLGVSKDATRSAEDALSTPLPGETLAVFYARSRKGPTNSVSSAH
ncbi:hypothetical protein FRC06_003921 [Ceratobasidium sp. 370]|nr:hypothetical protein FRC06_003921 [Ceratobasidium sp. 370]